MNRLERRSIELGFWHDRVPAGTHMCQLYADDAERQLVAARFLEEGARAGEKVLYVGDAVRGDDARAWLAEGGCTGWAERCDIRTAQETYFPQGSFRRQEMLDLVRDFFLEALREGHTGARGAGELNWFLRGGVPGAEEVLLYEAQLNDVLAEHPYTSICQYDARLLDGATQLEILQVHPYVIVRGQVVQNPHYLDSGELLRRRGEATAPSA